MNSTFFTQSKPFNERIIDFRNSKGLSREAFANELGISSTTLYRWENNITHPSPSTTEKLVKLGFGSNPEHVINIASHRVRNKPLKKTAAKHYSKLSESRQCKLSNDNYNFNILPSPFVRNGPLDQLVFHNKLLNMQITSSNLPKDVLARRLSLVEEEASIGKTAQYALEEPRPNALSWNSNYGPHGWHRYVGRFPSHVVRALLNYFGADRNSVVCDPFVGSGTTAVECRLLGIPFIGIEICPLSCMMTKTKSAFPAEPWKLNDIAKSYEIFYNKKWNNFTKGRQFNVLSHKQILSRQGNLIPVFTNIERWFTPEALLGTSITVEYGMSKDGFEREAILLALSSKMRSIGNVDVDVVRAEYSRNPRSNVDVRRLVTRQILKMAADISASLTSHEGLIGPPSDIKLYEGSVLDAILPDSSIDYIITSPPYGVEAISYLRTHLLSYRSLIAHLGHDPYSTRDKTIGSEYMNGNIIETEQRALKVSAACKNFFMTTSTRRDKKYMARRAAMIHFFDDMLLVAEKMAKWLKDNGQIAFIIGNNRLGDDVIPTDTIIKELFNSYGLIFEGEIKHKLKTNNSNSQVPWQARIIHEESILTFRRTRRRK